jgi:N utilization substance protein A
MAGLLEKNDMSREDAELFILKARVVAGWVEPQALEDALAARAAALDAEEAELDAASDTTSGTARSRGDELFNLKGANASSDQ